MNASRIIKAHEMPEPLPRWVPPPRNPAADMPSRRPDAAPGAAPTGDLRPTAADLREVESAARAEGLAKGMQAAEEAYRAKLARLERAAERLQAERTQFFDRLEPELVRLSVAIAEKIIQRELELRPETVVDIVRCAVKRLREREALRVSVNPADFERVREARDDLLATIDGIRKLDVLEDRRVDRGGCVIESPTGTLDARIRTQLDQVARGLGDAMAESGRESDPAAASAEVVADD